MLSTLRHASAVAPVRSLGARRLFCCRSRASWCSASTETPSAGSSSAPRSEDSDASRGPGIPTCRPFHRNLFRRLGFTDESSVTTEALNANYATLSRYYAPEHNNNHPQNSHHARRALRRIDEAFELLKDEDARRGYRVYMQAAETHKKDSSKGFDWEQVPWEDMWQWRDHHHHQHSKDPKHRTMHRCGKLGSRLVWSGVAFAALYAWGAAGTLEPNVRTFAIMWAVITFCGSVFGTTLLFLMYAPHRHDKVLAPHATVVPTTHGEARGLRLTGVRGSAQEQSKRSVEFVLKYPGAPEPDGLRVTSPLGQFEVLLPASVPSDVPLTVEARLKESCSTICHVHADLA